MKSVLFPLVVMTLPLFWSNVALAEEGVFDKCVAATDTNSGWQDCGEAEVARQETRLNAAWKKVLACFDPGMKGAKDELVFEERLWVKWKDGACGLFLNGDLGRLPQVTDGQLCKIKIVSDRADWLEQLSKNENVCWAKH